MRRLFEGCAYSSNYCNCQLESLLPLGQIVITFRTLLHLGQNVITFRTLLHLGPFITFRPSTTLRHMRSCCAQVLWSFRFDFLLHFGLYFNRTVLIWLILLKIGWTCPRWRRLFAWVATALVFSAERILILGFWLFVLISDLRGFLLLVFALAIKGGALSVQLLSLVFYFLGVPL